MRQGYCYTCLAIGGGGISVGSLRFCLFSREIIWTGKKKGITKKNQGKEGQGCQPLRGVELITVAMRNHTKDAGVQQSACGALWCLCAEHSENTALVNEAVRVLPEPKPDGNPTKRRETSSYQKRPFLGNFLFVRNFGRACSQFWWSLFAILFEGFLIQIQKEIHHFVVLGGGGLRGTRIVNGSSVNKLAFPFCEQTGVSQVS